MEKTYKVEVTEKEAKEIGERRERERIKRQAYTRILKALGIAMVFTVLAITFTGILSLVFAILVLLVVGIAFLLSFRYDHLATKAGKAFVETLKEEK